MAKSALLALSQGAEGEIILHGWIGFLACLQAAHGIIVVDPPTHGDAP